METKFNFNSQVCTSREQSERLLALGLKKETADCYLFEYEKGKYKVIVESWLDLMADDDYYPRFKDICTPAWSLHRLLSMLPKAISVYDEVFKCQRLAYFSIQEDYCVIYGDNSDDMVHKIFHYYDIYQNCVTCIEWLIKEGYFNKKYLNGTTEN